NHSALRHRLIDLGYVFTSETDTEVVAHLIAWHYSQTRNLLQAFRNALGELHGAYALALIHEDEPQNLYCARMGSPLVIGEGSGESYIASDPLALLQVTDRFRYLVHAAHARLPAAGCPLWDRRHNLAARRISRH